MSYIFKGISKMTSKIIPAMNCYSSYLTNRSIGRRGSYHDFDKANRARVTPGASPGGCMKLQLISLAVLAYTILTMAWICYANLGNQYTVP